MGRLETVMGQESLFVVTVNHQVMRLGYYPEPQVNKNDHRFAFGQEFLDIRHPASAALRLKSSFPAVVFQVRDQGSLQLGVYTAFPIIFDPGYRRNRTAPTTVMQDRNIACPASQRNIMNDVRWTGTEGQDKREKENIQNIFFT